MSCPKTWHSPPSKAKRRAMCAKSVTVRWVGTLWALTVALCAERLQSSPLRTLILPSSSSWRIAKDTAAKMWSGGGGS